MFGFRLKEPAKGDDITADWARELVKAVRSLRLHAGPGIRLTRTPDGTTISAPAAPSAEAPRTDAAIHFGDAEDAATVDSWSIADDTPAILEFGGDDWRARILIDTRGNIISYNVGDEDTPTPTPPREAPLCGNPLNAIDDQHPLGDDNNGGGGGGGGKAEADDYNPLNYEGDGGFTPTCGGEAA